MAKRKGNKRAPHVPRPRPQTASGPQPATIIDPASIAEFPTTYQELTIQWQALGQFQPFDFRLEIFRRIERVTGRPLICYVTKTHDVPPNLPTSIDDGDMIGFGDLIQTTPGDKVDVFVVSNGGSPEAAERIVQMLRDKFSSVRFIVASNAFSAATMICLSGEEVIMESMGTLGPIDPQINGIPARAILRSFETLEERMKKEGPGALTAYMPLISKYDLHILEICKSALELSKELAQKWLSQYMWRCAEDDARVEQAVSSLSDYDFHKSHGRSINRIKARELLGLNVRDAEDTPGLSPLIRALVVQYQLFFEQSPFFKLFENAYGITWGRQFIPVQAQAQQPGPLVRPQPLAP